MTLLLSEDLQAQATKTEAPSQPQPQPEEKTKRTSIVDYPAAYIDATRDIFSQSHTIQIHSDFFVERKTENIELNVRERIDMLISFFGEHARKNYGTAFYINRSVMVGLPQVMIDALTAVDKDWATNSPVTFCHDDYNLDALPDADICYWTAGVESPENSINIQFGEDYHPEALHFDNTGRIIRYKDSPEPEYTFFNPSNGAWAQESLSEDTESLGMILRILKSIWDSPNHGIIPTSLTSYDQKVLRLMESRLLVTRGRDFSIKHGSKRAIFITTAGCLYLKRAL